MSEWLWSMANLMHFFDNWWRRCGADFADSSLFLISLDAVSKSFELTEAGVAPTRSNSSTSSGLLTYTDQSSGDRPSLSFCVTSTPCRISRNAISCPLMYPDILMAWCRRWWFIEAPDERSNFTSPGRLVSTAYCNAERNNFISIVIISRFGTEQDFREFNSSELATSKGYWKEGW